MMNLNEKYNRDEFISFLSEIFLQDYQRDIRPISTSDFKSINKAFSLGRSKSLDLQVFEFEYSGSFNKRIALAKDAFQVMKQSAVFQALAVFHSHGSDDWRFSLMTANPQKTDKGGVALAYSNPRRYSFFLGPNAKVNTPIKFLLKRGIVHNLVDLKDRFSLEVVNKEFYKEISENFVKLVGGTLGVGRGKTTYKGVLKLPSIPEHSQISAEFAVRLIGRIIFGWFLREKRSPNSGPLMPRELLSLDAAKTNKDYYHSILEPIFFEILNQPVKSRKDAYFKEPYSLIPYLNGGLFSPHESDFYKRRNGDLQSQFHNTVVIPDEWFVEFFHTLETYNFTIDENTSFDEELSIDPEMLGRIFENLLAEINPETGESARKSTGSYYTPRMIVDYMVDESLLLYLKQHTSIIEEKLKAIISYDLTDDSEYPLNEDEKQEVINALERVKILDPACGSGAFPIGALQKMVFVLQQVDPEGHLWFKKQIKSTSPEIRRVIEREFTHKNFDYIRKLGVIRENIYGVDIQPIATEISRLRCFLTLVVDERIDDSLENRGIEPLPNLDFKFVAANSLIGLPTTNKQVQVGLFEDNEGISELKEIRDMFFNASGSERDALKLQFVQAQNKMFQRLISEGRRGHADLTTKLTSWDPFSNKASSWFDPEWMFGINEGFDIVIANPPYISYGLRGTQKMTPEERKTLVSFYPNSAEYKISIYAIFMDKAIQLAKVDGGIQTYIVPDSFLLGRYFSKVRGQILNNCEITHLSWMPYKIFEATVGFSIVYTFQKKNSVNAEHLLAARFVESNSQISNRSYQEYRYPQSYFKKLKHNRFRLFFDSFSMQLVQKIETGCVDLSTIVNFSSGLISKNGQENIISETQRDNKWKPGIASGGEINKYVVKPEGYYLLYDKEKIKSGYESVDYFSPKLLMRQTGDSIICAYDDRGLLALNNVHIGNRISESYDLKYVTAILNSSLIDWYYRKISLESGRTMAQTDIETVGGLPIKAMGKTEQASFVEIVNKIMALTGTNDYLDNKASQSQVENYERQIDRMVYMLYGLEEAEITTIEK